jgi:hypothetical protein
MTLDPVSGIIAVTATTTKSIKALGVPASIRSVFSGDFLHSRANHQVHGGLETYRSLILMHVR